jgi:hypothetical protein
MLVFAASVVAQSAKVSVLISGGFSAAYLELLPQFEKSTGITVTTARGASQGSGVMDPPRSTLSCAAVCPPTWSSCRGRGSPSY